MVLARLRTQRRHAVFPRPAGSALALARGHARAVVVAASQDFIHTFAADGRPGGLKPIRPRVVVGDPRSIGEISVLNGNIRHSGWRDATYSLLLLRIDEATAGEEPVFRHANGDLLPW